MPISISISISISATRPADVTARSRTALSPNAIRVPLDAPPPARLR